MTTIPEPTPPNHEADVSALITAIRDLVQAAIPNFGLATAERRRKIASAASLDDAFFEATAAACAAHEDLITAGKATPSDYRNTVNYSRFYRSLAEEFRMISRGVDDMVSEVRYEFGTCALMVYNYASRTNSPDERRTLIPHVAAMQRTLGRGRRAKKAAPVPTPTPIPNPLPPVPSPTPAPRVATLTADAGHGPQNWKGE